MEQSASRPSFDAGYSAAKPNVNAKHAKSSITNGTRLLPGIDNRSPWVRRCRDLMLALTNDRGGASEVSAAEASLIRRAAVMSVELEALEARFAQDGQASAQALDLYGRTAGNLRRTLETLGIDRRSRVVGSTLSDYLHMPADHDEVSP